MTEDLDLGDELALALDMADRADALTLPAFETGDFSLDWKANRTEVTEIDRGVESMIAAVLDAERPHHGRLGEEHGVAGDRESPWRWIVDPIDGTSGFVRGIPVWATLIALAHADRGVVVSVVSAPALGRRWWATQGGGAFADGRRCRVSAVGELTEAQVSLTPNAGWERLGLVPALSAISLAARRVRGFGDFWQHCLVAEGALDLAIDAVGVAPYDLAAVRLLVEEAGGAFTDRHGRPTHEHDTAVSSNGLLHADVIARLATTPQDRSSRHGVSGFAIDAEDRFDGDEVLALYAGVGWTAYTDQPDVLWRGLASSIVLTARQDGVLVGLARIVSDGATIAYLQDLVVDPGHQRLGVGRALVAETIRRFGHCRQVFLTTGANDPARRFYDGLGFVTHQDAGLVAYGLPR